MTLAERSRKNIAQLKLHPQFRHRLIPANEQQQYLTRLHILPQQEAFIAAVRSIREEVDAELSQDAKKLAHIAELGKKYPYGLCRELRDGVIAKLLDDAPPAHPLLAPFIEAGGIVQGFWGIDKGIYFQNAIQIGTSILDAANDTVDTEKDPIAFYSDLETAPIKRIEDFTEFADVSRLYWKQDIYPNIYLPELAPVFPILAVQLAKKSGGGFAKMLTLQTDVGDLYLKNVYTEYAGNLFGLSARFLDDSPYAAMRLPPALEAALRRSAALARHKKDSDLYRFASEGEDPSAAFRAFPAPARSTSLSSDYAASAARIRDAGRRLHKVILAEEG